jgi:transposase
VTPKGVGAPIRQLCAEPVDLARHLRHLERRGFGFRSPTSQCVRTHDRGYGHHLQHAKDDVVEIERKTLAVELLADVRRLDRDLVAIKIRIADAVAASHTSLLELHGVGPIVAGLILAHVGDPARFATKNRFASYNGTAPIEASSGPRTRHRLNPRGNRKLNHAMHLIAVTQIAHDTPGRVYYQRKIDEHKTKKEALRALKRRISDAVWRQLQVDLNSN